MFFEAQITKVSRAQTTHACGLSNVFLVLLTCSTVKLTKMQTFLRNCAQPTHNLPQASLHLVVENPAQQINRADHQKTHEQQQGTKLEEAIEEIDQVLDHPPLALQHQDHETEAFNSHGSGLNKGKRENRMAGARDSSGRAREPPHHPTTHPPPNHHQPSTTISMLFSFLVCRR